MTRDSPARRALYHPSMNSNAAARSRTAGEYYLGLAIGSIFSRNEPAEKPATIQRSTRAPMLYMSHMVAECVCRQFGTDEHRNAGTPYTD